MTIPDWVTECVNATCPYCGYPISNNDGLTDRYCSNPICPEHLAQKVVVLAKHFNVKGVGAAYAREVVNGCKLKYQTQMIPVWCPEPPKVQLWEVGEMCQIKGFQKRWRDIVGNHKSMYEVLRAPATPMPIKLQAPMLLYTESVCNVLPTLEGMKINIMMSGSFDRYTARADFVADMNKKYGDVVQLIDVGKRKTGVHYLVKEAHTSDHEKSAIALAEGIPIMTPSELEEKIKVYRTYILEGETKE